MWILLSQVLTVLDERGPIGEVKAEEPERQLLRDSPAFVPVNVRVLPASQGPAGNPSFLAHAGPCVMSWAQRLEVTDFA